MDGNDPNSKPADDSKPKPAKARKSKLADKATRKRSLNLSLLMEDYTRLATHALMHDITISDLVSKLAREHLREFTVHRNAATNAIPKGE
jgi:hypothetical protein